MHDDLLEQALRLATVDTKKPKQANLRRAVSAAYYALFHYLVEEACCAQIGAQHGQAPFRHVLARAFVHKVMKEACLSFGGGTLKASVRKGLPVNAAGQYVVLPPIQRIASAFVELQETRHLADYDRTERFNRSDVIALIQQAKGHIKTFSELPVSDDKSFFLACLWAWKELAGR